MESENSNAPPLITTTTLFALRLPTCAILAADSPKTSRTVEEIVDCNLARIVELYPKVVAGFSGDYEVIHMLANVLPDECHAHLRNPNSMQDVADFVAIIVNQSIDLIRRKDPVHREVVIVIVGTVGSSNADYKIFTINNNNGGGGGEYVYGAREELGNMYTDGAGKSGVNTFCINSGIDKISTMTEEEGVIYAFNGVNSAIRNYCFSGRPIHVISINPELDAVYHLWTIIILLMNTFIVVSSKSGNSQFNWLSSTVSTLISSNLIMIWIVLCFLSIQSN